MKTILAFLLSASVTFATPPTLDISPEIKGATGAFVEVRAKTDAKWVRYVKLEEGLAVFPPNLLSDKFVTVVVASKPGSYKMFVYAGNDEGGAEAIVTVVIQDNPGTVNPPVKPPPGGGGGGAPVDPPPVTKKKIGLLYVRKNGPPSPSEEAVITSPEWAKLVTDGKFTTVKEVTLAESLTIYKPVAGETMPIPAVIPFYYDEVTKKTKIYGKPLPGPTNDVEIRRLSEDIK